MRLKTFFEKFDLFADAPDAMAKMRELVLQLAVQGRLVSQSLNDEPADTLSVTIAASRATAANLLSALVAELTSVWHLIHQ